MINYWLVRSLIQTPQNRVSYEFVIVGKGACCGQAFAFHSWLDNTWYWHLGAVLRMHHSAIARDDKLDLEQCMATFQAVVAYQNSIDISFFFFLVST